MRFLLVAVSLAAATFAAPMPKNNIAVNRLIDTRGDISSDVTNLVSDALKAVKRQSLSKLEEEALGLVGDVSNVVGRSFKRSGISEDITTVLKDAESLLKRDSISDIGSEASKDEAEAEDLIAEAKAEIKAAE
jgi:hypothetical protein